MDSSPAPSASRKRSRTKDVLPDPAGPVKSRIRLQCSAGEENTKGLRMAAQHARGDIRNEEECGIVGPEDGAWAYTE
jgi:hypothetical protein